jgi:uncharacterized membrane protein
MQQDFAIIASFQLQYYSLCLDPSNNKPITSLRISLYRSATMSNYQINVSHNKQHSLKSIITINAPIKEAWQVLADFNNVYTWAPGVSESHGLGNEEQKIGAARYCKLADFGTIDEVVTQWQEGQGFTYTVSALGPLDNAISRWHLIEVDAQTSRLEVELAYDIRFGLFGKLMHRFVMRKKLETSLPQTLQAFKTRIETGNLVRPLINDPAAVTA